MLIFSLYKCAPNFSLENGKSANGYWTIQSISYDFTLLTPYYHMLFDDFRENRSYLICLNLPNIRYKRDQEVFGMGQTRIYICVVMLLLLHPFSFCNQPLMPTKLRKNTPWKWHHIGFSRLKGGFNGLRCLSDSQIILL